MSHSFAYFCFDLDGTLLDSNKRISEEALKAINNLKQAGKHIIIASGRHYGEMRQFAGQLGLSDGDYLISCDGQYVHDTSGAILYESEYLSRKDVETICNVIRTRSYVTTDGGDYIVEPSCIVRCLNWLKRLLGHGTDLYGSALALPSELKVEKVRFYGSAMLDSLAGSFCVHDNHDFDGQVDVKAKGVNKLTALSYILNLTATVSFDSVLYFGNDINDIECFEGLKWTVAMSNSPERIKKRAAFITDGCDHDGVAIFLNAKILV